MTVEGWKMCIFLNGEGDVHDVRIVLHKESLIELIRFEMAGAQRREPSDSPRNLDAKAKVVLHWAKLFKQVGHK